MIMSFLEALDVIFPVLHICASLTVRCLPARAGSPLPSRE
jgi:hypothetical protein